MAEDNKPASTKNTGDGEKKGVLGKVGKFVAGQLFDIQFTNPFTGAVHNLLNAIPNSGSIKNAFKNFFKRGAVFSRDFKHEHVLPIDDVIDALATVLNTTFYGFNKISSKMTKIKNRNLNAMPWSKREEAENGMNKVEFARMCKKCPVKMHNSASRSNFKDAYWTILEPNDNEVADEFNNVFHIKERIMLLYWNDMIKGNAPKVKEGMRDMLGAWKVDGKYVVKSSSRPSDGEEGSPKISKPKPGETEAEKRERERIEQANAMKRKKGLGITAGAGEFSFDPVIVEDFLQAKKLGIKWVVVLRDTSQKAYGDDDTVSESEKDDEEEDKSTKKDALNGLIERYGKEEDDSKKALILPQLKRAYDAFANERSESIDRKIESYTNYIARLKNIIDDPSNEDERIDKAKAKKSNYENRIENLKLKKILFSSEKLKDEGKRMITLSKSALQDEIEELAKSYSGAIDSLIPPSDSEPGRSESEVVGEMDMLKYKSSLAKYIMKNFSLGGETHEETSEREDKNKKLTEIEELLKEMNITKGVLNAICDIRDMEKSLDDKELKDTKKLNDKLKNIKSADDFHLGLTYDPDDVYLRPPELPPPPELPSTGS